MVVEGPAVSGPALLLGIADFVVMTEDAYAFVSGPHMVQAFTGVPVTNIGLGGAGVGIGNIFGSMIQAVARQPELKGELQGIQWLGFALTEAVVFYGLIGGLLAYVLV